MEVDETLGNVREAVCACRNRPRTTNDEKRSVIKENLRARNSQLIFRHAILAFRPLQLQLATLVDFTILAGPVDLLNLANGAQPREAEWVRVGADRILQVPSALSRARGVHKERELTNSLGVFGTNIVSPRCLQRSFAAFHVICVSRTNV